MKSKIFFSLLIVGLSTSAHATVLTCQWYSRSAMPNNLNAVIYLATSGGIPVKIRSNKAVGYLQNVGENKYQVKWNNGLGKNTFWYNPEKQELINYFFGSDPGKSIWFCR